MLEEFTESNEPSSGGTVKFKLGRVVVTRGVDAHLINKGFKGVVDKLLERHSSGDWGDICEEDGAANDMALITEERILSTYPTPSKDKPKIWIITEWDRSVTTVLFPDEY